MKILHFISSPASGGAEIYVRDLAIRMSQLGHEVMIVFLSDSKSMGRDLDFEKEFLKKIASFNIEYFILGTRSRLDLVLCFFRLRRVINFFKPDIFHAHLHYAVIYLSLFSGDVVYTHHTILPRVPLFLYKLYNFRVGKYIGISAACQKALAGFTGRPVTRIDNAIDSQRLGLASSKREDKCDSQIVTILAIGRIVPVKNYDMLVDVSAELLKSGQKFKVLLAGEGSQERVACLRSRIQALGLEECFELLGQCNDIPALLQRADIFVMTSIAEGLPISLLEASFSGLPAVVTDVGSCAEVIERCQSGYVVGSGDVADFAEKIRNLIEDKELRKTLSDSALENSKYYEIDRSAAQHIDAYREVLVKKNKYQERSV